MTREELFEQIKNRTIELSYSSLKEFNKSPRHFVEYKTRPRRVTHDMNLGSLGHFMLLQPDRGIEEEFMVGGKAPNTPQQVAFCESALALAHERAEDGDVVFTEDIFKEAFGMHYNGGSLSKTLEGLGCYFEATLAGKIPVQQEDVDTTTILKDAAWSDPVARKILSKLEFTERKLQWESFNAWRMVGYLDGGSKQDGFIVDLKFTDADPKSVSKQVQNMWYFTQAAMYRQGALLNGEDYPEYYIIAVGSDGNVSVHYMDQEYMGYGLHQYRMWLQEFNKAATRKKFGSGYDFYGEAIGLHRGMHKLEKPGWAPELGPIYGLNQ